MEHMRLATNELHKAFRYMNDDFFGGTLPEVALTIQAKGKRKAYGWFSVEPIWTGENQEKALHEINMSAEYMNRDYLEIMRTLLHEMVHLYNHVNGIKDTSRGNTFHNAAFKKSSEEHGFYYDEPAHKSYGWAFSKLKPETIEVIKKYNIIKSAFELARINESAKVAAKKKTVFKWVCPNCQQIARTTKPSSKLFCGVCYEEDETIVMMEEEE